MLIKSLNGARKVWRIILLINYKERIKGELEIELLNKSKGPKFLIKMKGGIVVYLVN